MRDVGETLEVAQAEGLAVVSDGPQVALAPVDGVVFIRRNSRNLRIRCPAPQRRYISIAASNFASASERCPVDSSAEPQLFSVSASSSDKLYFLESASAFSKYGANGRRCAAASLPSARSIEPTRPSQSSPCARIWRHTWR